MGKDDRIALQYWLKADKLGDAAAPYNLSCVYKHGLPYHLSEGVRKDAALAQSCMQRAGNRGNARAIEEFV